MPKSIWDYNCVEVEGVLSVEKEDHHHHHLSPVRKEELSRAVEILEVEVRKIGTKELVYFAGTICLTTPSGGKQLLFKSGNFEPNNRWLLPTPIPLKESLVRLPTNDGFDITFNFNGYLEELNDETVRWVPDSSPSNQRTVEEVRGRNRNSLLDVSYIVYERALIAHVEIRLTRLKLPHIFQSEGLARVHGCVTAFSTETAELVVCELFYGEHPGLVEFRLGEVLRLSKSSFGVSYGSDININVHLLNVCHPFVMGSVHLVPKYYGTYVAVISSVSCDIEVSVTCSSS